MEAYSYSHRYPEFRRVYGDFIALAQLAGALVVVSTVLFTDLRAKLAYRVLALFWLLMGLNYYANTVGGPYGVAMLGLCIGEVVCLLVNWERLRVFGEISFSVHLVLPMDADFKSLNGTLSSVGACSLLVCS